MAEMLNDPETVYSALKELANHDLTTARGIVNTIKDTYNRIKDKFTHNEGKYYGKYAKLGKYEEAIKLFEKAVRDGAKNRGVNTNINNNVQYDIGYTTDNLPVVMLKDDIFDGKTGKPHEVISNFIADQIGNGYDISESGQKVYIGKDLPNEYTQSEYTKLILKKFPRLLKVKNQSAQNIKEIIEIATDRRWDKNTKTKHNVDAKYGFYKYTSRVALPVKDSKGNIVRSNVYDVELVIRNDADGKKYLYDIQKIKKSVKQLTSTWNSKSVIKTQHSNNIVPQKTVPVNTNSTQNSGNYAYSDGDVQNNAMAEALAKAGLTNNTQNDFTDYSQYKSGVESAKKAVDDAIKEKSEDVEPITIGVVSVYDNKAINSKNKVNDSHRGNFKGYERTVSKAYLYHAYKEHSNPIKEALRGQLALTKEDIKTAIEKLSKGESRVVQDTYTTKGQPSVLSEIQINGYSYYAEEILKDSFDLRTIYKAPTPTQATAYGTKSPLADPRNRNVSASKISIAQNTQKSTGNFVIDENGNVEKHGGLDCSGGFNYYDTKFAVDNSGVIYGGTVIVRINSEGKRFFYDLDNIRETGYQDENEFYPVNEISPLPSFANENISSAKEETSLDKSVPQNTPIVNGNNSGNSTNNNPHDFTDYSQYKSSVESAKKAVDDAIKEKSEDVEPITIGVVSVYDNKAINSKNKVNDSHRGNFKGYERTVSKAYLYHAYKEHSNPIKEALRGQLPLTKEDIKTAIEKLSKGESRVVQDTYTTKGQPSVLSEIQINGYSYYAEEILKDSFDLRTIYKAPTPTQANVPGTMRPGTVPRNRDVSASKISIAQNNQKSTGNFVIDENGNVKKHGGLDCSDGFNYYDTKFAVDNSGVIYGGTVIVRIDKHGRLYFYDLDNIREAGYQDENEFYPVKEISPSFSFANENISSAKEKTSLDKSVPQNTPIVNGNNSGNSTNNTQNDFTDYSQYKSGVESAKKAVDDAVDGNKRSSESITIGAVSEAENKVINRMKNDDRHL